MSEAAFSSAEWNRFLDEHKLMGSRCPACGGIYLPPRAICPRCHSEQLEWVELAGRGKLAAFTSIYVGPTFMNAEGFDRNNPYCTGIVELDEGVKISARILGVDARSPAAIRIGTPMTVEFLPRSQGEKKDTVLAFKVAE